MENRPRIKPEEIIERVVQIRRVAKVLKGGRRFNFSTLVVVGNGNGLVGCGLGKAREVRDSIIKGREKALKNLVEVAIVDGTIPHPVKAKYCKSVVVLLPAMKGTGVIAGSAVRTVLEAAGVQNVLTKSLGSNTPVNLVKATIEALRQLKTKEEYMKLRGKLKDGEGDD